MIEGAATEPFATFVSREILAPLGMARTALEGTAGTEDDRDSVPYYFRAEQDDDSESRTAPAADYACFFGAGAFLSTPSDLVRLGSAWLEPRLLKAETVTLFQEPLRLASGASSGFALGWKVDTIPFAGGLTRAVRHRAILM